MTHRYKTSYKSSRGLKRFHVSFTGESRPPETLRQELTRKIAEKERFIQDYPNYGWLCDEAKSYIETARQQLLDMDYKEHSEECTCEPLGDACPACRARAELEPIPW